MKLAPATLIGGATLSAGFDIIAIPGDLRRASGKRKAVFIATAANI